ncbi:MAG: dipeptidase, partial [Bacteroidales bacterium]|nr:dipeptidase [Bacteroidales bacterium]
GTSCLTPIYASSTATPASYARGNGDLLTYREDAAFWIFTRVAHLAYLKYNVMMPDIRKVMDELELGSINYIPSIDAVAMDLMKNNPETARGFLTEFSVTRAEYTVKRWKELYGYLMVKYADGNVKKEENGKFLRNAYGMPESPDHPAYPEFWLRKIVEDHGEKIRAPKE